MSRRAAALVLLVGLVVGVAALLWLRRVRATGPRAAAAGAVAAAPTETVVLYFPGAAGLLYPERRELPAAAAEGARLRAVVAAVLDGPRREGLVAPLPPGVEVAGVVVAPEGVVYVDLRSPNGAPPPPSGSTRERLMLYSLVNSVALNAGEAARVVLLWNGVQPAAFAGHLDTSRPLAADPGLLAERP